MSFNLLQPDVWLAAEYPYLSASMSTASPRHFIIGDEGRLWYFAEPFASDLGFEVGEVLERPFLEHLHPDDRETSAVELDRVHESGGPQTFTARVGCADGSWRWYVWMVFRAKGQPSLFGAALDATPRRRIPDLPVISPTHEAPWDSQGLGRETVLVVEDEDSLLEVMRRMLSALGHRVLTASRGEDALRQAAEYGGEIRLLVTDISLPGMSGQELSERLSELRPGLRTVFVTGFIDDDLLLGQGKTVLHKPFQMHELLERVREAMMP